MARREVGEALKLRPFGNDALGVYGREVLRVLIHLDWHNVTVYPAETDGALIPYVRATDRGISTPERRWRVKP